MPFETRAADGGLFRVINGRRVWIANPPNSFIHEELTGPGYLPQPNGGPGESPGRAEAVERAKQRSADKARLKTSKKPKR